MVSVKYPPDSVECDRWRRVLKVYHTLLQSYVAISSVAQHPLPNEDETALIRERRIVGLGCGVCVRGALNHLRLRRVALQDLLISYLHWTRKDLSLLCDLMPSWHRNWSDSSSELASFAAEVNPCQYWSELRTSWGVKSADQSPGTGLAHYRLAAIHGPGLQRIALCTKAMAAAQANREAVLDLIEMCIRMLCADASAYSYSERVACRTVLCSLSVECYRPATPSKRQVRAEDMQSLGIICFGLIYHAEMHVPHIRNPGQVARDLL